jgi:hypothetical protein
VVVVAVVDGHVRLINVAGEADKTMRYDKIRCVRLAMGVQTANDSSSFCFSTLQGGAQLLQRKGCCGESDALRVGNQAF